MPRPLPLNRYARTVGDCLKLIPRSGALCRGCFRPILHGEDCGSCTTPLPRIWMRPSWVIMNQQGWSGGIAIGPNGIRSNTNWCVSWWDVPTTHEDTPVLYPTRGAAAKETDFRGGEQAVKCHRTEDGGLYFPATCSFVSLADLRRMAGRA